MSKLITTSTFGMSRPREATSVAIRMSLSFDLNLLRALSLYCYARLPLMLTALKLRNRSMSASYSDYLRVEVKMIIFLPANYVRRKIKYVSLYFEGRKR